MPCGNCGDPLTPGRTHKCGRVGSPYAPSSDWKPGQDTFAAQAAGIWDEGFAAGRAAATPGLRNGWRAPHCFSEYGTPCGTCPAEKPETPDSTAEKLASPRKHSASASDPMPLCDCELCARPLRDHDEEETRGATIRWFPRHRRSTSPTTDGRGSPS